MNSLQPLSFQSAEEVTVKDGSIVHVAVVVEVKIVLQDLTDLNLADAEGQIEQDANELGTGDDVELVLVVLHQDLPEVEVELCSLSEHISQGSLLLERLLELTLERSIAGRLCSSC